MSRKLDNINQYLGKKIAIAKHKKSPQSEFPTL